MSRLAVLATIGIMITACAGAPLESDGPPVARAETQCVGMADEVCAAMLAAVQVKFADQVANASRVLIVDTCPLEASCDRAFQHDAAVAIVPASGNTNQALLLHVFGNDAQPVTVESWNGPLPDRFVELLDPGG